jgi:hypothetical protein
MADAVLTGSAEACGVEAVAPLALPPRTVVRSATVVVHAEAAGARVPLAQVARVRPADGADPSESHVVDFGALVIVAGLKAPAKAGIARVAPWLGSRFGDPAPLEGELRTERLLVTLAAPIPAASFAADATVALPAPPADLDLAVGGTRQWFAAGPARSGAGGAFEASVDVTAAVQAAVAAGQLPVPVSLRSSAPGRLRVSPTVRYVEVHDVVFPEGAARIVEATAEGPYSLALPLPPEASAWRVQGVRAAAAARIGPERILPARKLELSAAGAQLVLDPDHAIAVRLPPEQTVRFAQLTALRLPLAAAPEGAELAGTLLAGTPLKQLAEEQAADEPGMPIANAQLGPLNLEPGPPLDPDKPALASWVTLPLSTPYAPGESSIWALLELARGAVLWPLVADPAARNPLRQPTPNGFDELSKVAGVETGSAPLRVAGIAPTDDPVPALVVSMPGAETPAALTPTPDGTPFAITAADGAEPLGDRPLALELTVATPGSYSFGGVRVEYTTEEP